MPDNPMPVAIMASKAPLRTRPILYPKPVAAMLATRLAGRHKRPLGDLFGLENFGVNLTRLEPGALSSLRHAHVKQDEFVFILEGHPTLLTKEGATRLSPGMCASFRAGTSNAHTLINETVADMVYLEIGDRTSGDEVTYPDDNLRTHFNDGQWAFSHKNGTPY